MGNEFLTMENVFRMLNSQYTLYIEPLIENYGVLLGIGFPILEAFFPPVPLAAIVLANISIFGFGLGYLYSLIGTCIGSMCVYYIVKKIARDWFERFSLKHERLHKIKERLKHSRPDALFFLLCFPATPSCLVSIAAGIVGLTWKEYFIPLVFGKTVMIFLLSYVSHHIIGLFSEPLKSALVLCGLLAAYLVFRKVYQNYMIKNDLL